MSRTAPDWKDGPRSPDQEQSVCLGHLSKWRTTPRHLSFTFLTLETGEEPVKLHKA